MNTHTHSQLWSVVCVVLQPFFYDIYQASKLLLSTCCYLFIWTIPADFLAFRLCRIMSALYRTLIAVADKRVPPRLRPLWEHPAGPKTVFFWSPLMKWALVVAGLSDLNRPVEKISPSQSASLSLTGFIWARYCLVITPKNYALMLVNLLVGFTNLSQLARVGAARLTATSTDSNWLTLHFFLGSIVNLASKPTCTVPSNVNNILLSNI